MMSGKILTAEQFVHSVHGTLAAPYGGHVVQQLHLLRMSVGAASPMLHAQLSMLPVEFADAAGTLLKYLGGRHSVVPSDSTLSNGEISTSRLLAACDLLRTDGVESLQMVNPDVALMHQVAGLHDSGILTRKPSFTRHRVWSMLVDTDDARGLETVLHSEITAGIIRPPKLSRVGPGRATLVIPFGERDGDMGHLHMEWTIHAEDHAPFSGVVGTYGGVMARQHLKVLSKALAVLIQKRRIKNLDIVASGDGRFAFAAMDGVGWGANVFLERLPGFMRRWLTMVDEAGVDMTPALRAEVEAIASRRYMPLPRELLFMGENLDRAEHVTGEYVIEGIDFLSDAVIHQYPAITIDYAMDNLLRPGRLFLQGLPWVAYRMMPSLVKVDPTQLAGRVQHTLDRRAEETAYWYNLWKRLPEPLRASMRRHMGADVVTEADAARYISTAQHLLKRLVRSVDIAVGQYASFVALVGDGELTAADRDDLKTFHTAMHDIVLPILDLLRSEPDPAITLNAFLDTVKASTNAMLLKRLYALYPELCHTVPPVIADG